MIKPFQNSIFLTNLFLISLIIHTTEALWKITDIFMFNECAGDLDYVSFRQEITFPPDLFFMTVGFTILDDDVVESNETVQLVLMEGLGEKGVRFPEGSMIEGTILDDNDSKEYIGWGGGGG